MQDNGVTYNVYDDRAGQARPWQLDIVPFILSSADWKKIEAAVIQRAMLADLLLRDVYGPQRLIARRRAAAASGHRPSPIPAPAVRHHAGAATCMCIFIPPTWRAGPTAPGGSWHRRADAPGGLGYALENRLVVAQTFPESFGDMRVARLAAFFNAYQGKRAGAGRLAPRPRRAADARAPTTKPISSMSIWRIIWA